MIDIIHPHAIPQHPRAVYIGREHSGRGRGPSFSRSPWANPWKVRKVGQARAVELFAKWIAGDPEAASLIPSGRWPRPTEEAIRRELAGRTLACWCPPGEPCHGQVIAEIANGAALPARAASLTTTSVIITGNCLEHLSAMEAGSVNLVVADPPYNIGIDYGDGRNADRMTDAAYIAWSRKWITAVARVLTDDGGAWIVCDAAYGADIDLAIRAAGLTIRDRGVWFETFGTYRGGNARPNFGKDWRPWFHAVKDPDRYTFNFTDADMRVPSARQTKYGDGRADPRGRVMSNVWQVPRLVGTSKERVKTPGTMKSAAPTQLPLGLVLLPVRGFSNPGDLVVDPFAGTGTTGVVCVESGRRFIGIELRWQFAAIARSRINTTAGELLAHRTDLTAAQIAALRPPTPAE